MPKTSKRARRHDRILSALDLNPTIRVSSLASELGVSPETVRRDLDELDRSGRIKRTYGGAVRARSFEPALGERARLHIAERERIARLAVEALGDADSMFVGGGATTLHFARVLRRSNRRLTVLTPAFSIATELSTNPLIEVMALPGIVEPKEGLVYGAETVRSIRQFRPSLAVTGASGIDADGVSEALLTAAQICSAMIETADETLVLADASKFGHRALQLTTGWSPRVCLVTDSAPPDPIRAAIARAGARIITG